MKKFKMALILTFVFIISALIIISCNEPGDGQEKKNGDAKEVIITLKGFYDFGANDGTEIKLEDFQDKSLTVLDISNYAYILVSGVQFYTSAAKDNDGKFLDSNKIAVMPDGNAHYNLLSASGDWEGGNRIFKPDSGKQIYNMKNGDNSKEITNETGVPKLLYIAKSSTASLTINGVYVESVTFVPKDGAVVLGKVNGDDLSVAGNKIIFTNADNTSYNSGAAIYYFDEGVVLKDKSVHVKFTIENYAVKQGVEHQLVIQGSCGTASNQVYYDGHQHYPILDDCEDFNTSTGTGTFKLDGNKLLDAGRAKNPPFDTTAFRIINNGGTTNNDKPEKPTREKTYTLIINSVTVK